MRVVTFWRESDVTGPGEERKQGENGSAGNRLMKEDSACGTPMSIFFIPLTFSTLDTKLNN